MAAPDDDRHVALHFFLDELLSDFRLLADLERLLDDDDELCGFGGDPGWDIERRRNLPTLSADAYSGWPQDAEFCASVDPDGLHLAHPRCFLQRTEFARFVLARLTEYFDDVHGKTVAARRALDAKRNAAARVMEKLQRMTGKS